MQQIYVRQSESSHVTTHKDHTVTAMPQYLIFPLFLIFQAVGLYFYLYGRYHGTMDFAVSWVSGKNGSLILFCIK
jgi:hypothetical protein